MVDLSVQSLGQRMVNLAQDNTRRLEDVTISIASQRRFQTYSGYANEGFAAQIINLEDAIEGIDAFRRTNTQIKTRSEQMVSSIDQLIDQVTDFKADLASRINGSTGSTMILDVIGANALDQMADLINVKFDDRYLFSGTRIDTPPVANVQSPNLTNGAANTLYYQGNNTKPTVRTSENESFTYGVLASDSAFAKAIGGVHLAIQGHNNDSLTDLQSAGDMLDESISALVAIRGEISNDVTRLEKSNLNLDQAEVVINERLIEIRDTDIVSATVESSELETIIQAIYLSYNRASGLRLANFLQ